MPCIERNGALLHYKLDGEPGRPVLVLSNSLGADISMWDAQMPEAYEKFRVLRYDTRGHGKSGMPAEKTSLADLGGDLLALLDALTFDAVHLCGVSLGGLTAMWLAIHAGERLRSLVLSNTAAKIGTTEAWNERIALVKAEGLEVIAERLLSRWFSPDFLAERDKVEPQKHMLLRCSTEGYVAASAALRDGDLREQIASIRVPTLILSGLEDFVTPPSDGAAMHASIPESRFEQVPGAHLANIEYPVTYNRALFSFLLEQRQ